MNFPLFSCKKCGFSGKESFLMSKDSQMNKDERFKKEKSLISSKNDTSINNLEIIDYPYPSNLNTDESFKKIFKNGTHQDDNNITINNDSFMKIQGLIKENLVNNNLGVNRNTLNSSSGIIKNEDSITQNKIILNNLYSDYNNNNILNKKNMNYNDNSNVIEKIDKNNFNNLFHQKSENNLKNIIEKTKNQPNKSDMKLEFNIPNTDRLTMVKANNLIESKIIKTERKKRENTLKISLKKSKKIVKYKNNINNNKNNNIKDIKDFKNNLNIISNDNNKNKKMKKINNKKSQKKDKDKILNKQIIKNILNNNENNNPIKIIMNKKDKVRNKKDIESNLTNIYKTINLTNKNKLMNSSDLFRINRIYSYKNKNKLLLNRVNLVSYNYRNTFSKSNEKRRHKNISNIKKIIKKPNIILTAREYFNPFDANQKNAKNSLDFEYNGKKI